MKLPLMIALFGTAEGRELDLARLVEITTVFRSVHDRSPYRLDAGDVDARLAARVGTLLPVLDLIERMITESSNEATNLLFPLVNLGSLRAMLNRLGATDTVVARPIGDRVAERAGRTNLVSAADLAGLLVAVATNRAVSPASCRSMLGILERQQHRDGIPSVLPPGVVTAGKNGWLDDCLHDAALVYPPDAPPYALAVCTSGMPNEDSRQVIRSVSAAVYADRHRF